ncbi:MAG: plasmid mobilization relaxosome protein MobC [Fusobacterium necrophorum]|nr:plasmid mobilization relaxosome protein MobC [Fusobacterium necrophorum]
MDTKFTVRLKKIDQLKLKAQAKELNISQSELIRELIRKNFGADIKEHNELIKEIRIQLRGLSTNINQIAKKVNSKKLLDELEEAKRIHKEVDRIWQLLRL